MITTHYRSNWYLPTFLRSDDDSCSLIVYVYTITSTQHGEVNVHNQTECHDFPDEDEMVDFIQKSQATELDAAADGNPRYVPPQVLKVADVLRSRN